MESFKSDIILKIADCISGNNPDVHNSMIYCLDEQAAYRKQYKERYGERGINSNTCNEDTLCWIGMVDELIASGYVVGVDSCFEVEDFLWAVNQLNRAKDIDFSKLPFIPDDDIYTWYEICNEYLKSQDMVLCGIDIDSDDVEMILVTTTELEKISQLAESIGHRIVPAEIL